MAEQTLSVQHAQNIAGLSHWYHVVSTPLEKSEVMTDIARFWRLRGQFGKAKQAFEQALVLNPDSALAQEGAGIELLRLGDFNRGMPLFEAGRWRLERQFRYKRPFALPYWGGGPLDGVRLLLWAEQGIGDQIMQVRLVSALLERGAHITLEAEARLFDLLGPVRQRITCVHQTEVPSPEIRSEHFDLQTSALSAWRFLEYPITCQPYLFANSEWSRQYKAAWDQAEEGPQKGRLNIGLSWFSTATEGGAYRSLDLSWLQPLARHQKQARFHSLQYGVDDLHTEAKKMQVTLCHDPQLDPYVHFDKLAAYIGFMDLVITIDNTTAHLAGALGVETWLLLPKSCHWYWGAQTQTTALYPNVHVLKAQEDGQWYDVLAELYDHLEGFIATRAGKI